MKREKNTFFGDTFVSIKKFNNVNILRNNNYLPLGFTYNSYIYREEFQRLSKQRKDIVLLKAVVLDESNEDILQGLSVYDLDDIRNEYSFKQYGKDIENRRSDVLTITKHSQNMIKGKIKLEKKKLLFFSIPYDQGWSAQVDGQKAKLELVSIGFMGLLLGPGEHTVELEYSPPYLVAGMIVSVMTLFLFAFFIWVQYGEIKRGARVE